MVEVIVVLLPAVASIAWLNRASNKQTVCQPRQAVGAGMEWGGDAGRYQTRPSKLISPLSDALTNRFAALYDRWLMTTGATSGVPIG